MVSVESTSKFPPEVIILNTDISFFIHASNKLYFHNHALKVFAIEMSFFILKKWVYIFI